MALGTLVGLPALRMRGLYLALITLMLAGAITVVLASLNFPNGGHGFSGYNGALLHIPPIRRPGIAKTDPAYFRYSVVAAVIMFLLVLIHVRTKPGRAWAAIRQSEPAALAAGINTTLYKLWAFALASFVTGVAGGVLAGAVRYLYSIDFQTQDSITLLAVVLMGGAYSIWGAIVAGLLLQLLPAILNDLGVSPDWLVILFGIGVLQVLTTAPTGIVDQLPRDIARLFQVHHAARAGARRPVRDRRHDRGLRAHRPLRRRHVAGRHERHLPVGHLRPDRSQRRRQDDLLQRPVGLRPPRLRAASRRSARTCSRWPTSAAPAGACAARSRPSRRSRTCPSTTTSR